MPSTTTVTLVEHELDGGAVLEDHDVDTRYPYPPVGDRWCINTSSTDDDDITQSDVDDGSGGSSDGTGPETEALEKEMGRYVPRTKPSPPAVGVKGFSTPYTQGKGTSLSTKSGRPLAVTATVKTTAPRPK
ncbi:hypothetical protein EDB85DRAFT_2149263 [Lactarius pseudohatsudake]|nr:hypothetical protein EDB85DRAFT_2149263 [Lactarius pseudohatsudake]